MKKDYDQHFKRFEKSLTLLEKTMQSKVSSKTFEKNLDNKANITSLQKLEEKYSLLGNEMVGNQFRARLVFKVIPKTNSLLISNNKLKVIDLAIDQPSGWINSACHLIQKHLEKSFMVGDRMSRSNQILSSFVMKIKGKQDDEIQNGEVAEYIGQVLAEMDSSLDTPFKNWVAERYQQARNPTVKSSEEFEKPEVSRRTGPEQIISDTKMDEKENGGESGRKFEEPPPPEVTQMEETPVESRNERMAKALKRYKQMKSGQSLKIRKKMKLNKGDSSDQSSDSDTDTTRTSGTQRADFRLQKTKIKEAESAVKKWNKIKKNISNKN